ncbi:MAG: hypothetical protein ACP5O4_02240 [bacterium]|jgi:hypothetical protein
MKIKKNNLKIFFLVFVIWILFFKVINIYSIEDNSLEKAQLYEEKGYNYYKIAKNYYYNKDYKYSSLNYVNAISYLTLAYIIYLDKLNNREKFFNISKDVLFFSNELNISLSKIQDKSKTDTINSIYASNYLNMASTLQKIYATDPKYSIDFYKNQYIPTVNNLYKKENNKEILKTDILIQIAIYYKKSIDYYLLVNDYDKANKSFEDLKKYNSLVKNKEVEKILKEVEKKLKK